MEDLIVKAVEAMPEERKEWIRNAIPRGHSLRQRLDRLAERMPDSCRDRLLFRTQRDGRRREVEHETHSAAPASPKPMSWLCTRSCA